jgi:oxygen-independent coproporphyrinogen-3 oxidase
MGPEDEMQGLSTFPRSGSGIDRGARTAVDFAVNFQRLRHSRAARVARRVLYRVLCGPGWPMRFLPPEPGWAPGAAPHLYVHLPFCRSICPHCPYVKFRYRKSDHLRSREALLREVDAYASRPDAPPVESLYFGGGTPTATPDIIEAVISRLSGHVAPGCEIGVEVHPGDASRGMLERLRNAGVTRISLGIESFRQELLDGLARGYTPAQAAEALRNANEVGFECVDANLIFGMPGQRPEEVAEDARRCMAYGVQQISAYQLFTFDHTLMGRGRGLSACGERERARAERMLSDVCLSGGLERTSPWNYSLRGVTPYSTVTRSDYVGFGVGAGSKVGGVFWFNTFSLEAYTAASPIATALVMQTTPRFCRAHWLYWRLYGLVVDPGEYTRIYGRSFGRDYGWLLRALAMLGMARYDGSVWSVTPSGVTSMHRLQQLFSLTYIDDMWSRCRDDAWPREVVLA